MIRFDRIIPPGGKGHISLKVNLTGLRGAIKKSARVYTNDPTSSSKLIVIKAFVNIPIRISPRQVYLIGDEGSFINKSVTIIANEEKPLELEPIQFNLADRVSYNIEEMKQGKIFKVNLKYKPSEGRNFRGVLVLKTNYPEQPEISISIIGNIKKKTTSKDKG